MSEYTPHTSIHTCVCVDVQYYLCGLKAWDAAFCCQPCVPRHCMSQCHTCWLGTVALVGVCQLHANLVSSHFLGAPGFLWDRWWISDEMVVQINACGYVYK